MTGSGCLKPRVVHPLNRVTEIKRSTAAGFLSDNILRVSIILAPHKARPIGCNGRNERDFICVINLVGRHFHARKEGKKVTAALTTRNTSYALKHAQQNRFSVLRRLSLFRIATPHQRSKYRHCVGTVTPVWFVGDELARACSALREEDLSLRSR